MTIPTFETVRIVHPNIPGSEHDVPKESLVIMRRSGWVRVDELEAMAKAESDTSSPPLKESPVKEEPPKTETVTASRKSSGTTKKDES